MKKEKVVIASAILAFSILLVSLFLLDDFLYLKDKITGAAEIDTRAIILTLNETICETNYTSGWNLISIPCIPRPENLTTVLSSVQEGILSVHTFYSSDTIDPWKAYNPNLPSWVINDLVILDRKQGYWLQLDTPQELFLNASVATPNLIPLNPGWNLIGYPTMSEKNISEALSSIYPNYEIVILHNSSDSADYWREYSWDPSVISDQDLIDAVPYYGYWVYMDSTDMLVIDW